MEKTQKRFLIWGVVCSFIAITFAVLYYLDVIKFLDNYLALVYIFFFMGMALNFAAAYTDGSKRFLKKLLYIIGLLTLIASIVMLVYGYIKGYIDFSFKF